VNSADWQWKRETTPATMPMARNSLVVAVAALALALVGVPLGVSGRSGGVLGSCDLTPVTWPTAANKDQDIRNMQYWPNGKFGKNFTSAAYQCDTGIMSWTHAPIPTGAYTIRSGDGPLSQDTQYYTPGGTLNEIHLRVIDIDMRFLGLVLYATTGIPFNSTTETRVGSWELQDTRWFQLPSSCGGNVVTHRGAQEKPMHTRHYWAAPVGTGTVRFRVLIKQGVQGRGQFYYPAFELTLREGPAPVVPQAAPSATNPDGTPAKYERTGPISSTTIVGKPGVACADVCAVQASAIGKPFCDTKATIAIDSVAAWKGAQVNVACQLPILAGCAFIGGPQVSERNECTYRSTDVTVSCPKALHTADINAPVTAPIHAADVCFSAPAPKRRAICVCTNDDQAQMKNPFQGLQATAGKQTRNAVSASPLDQDDPDAPANAAPASSSMSVGLLVMLAAFSSLFTGVDRPSSSRVSGLLSLLVSLSMVSLMLPSVSGHNYFMSIHRASTASTTNPCPARIGNQPHAQVIAGQEFIIEWTNGHFDSYNSPVYFAVVPTSEMAELTVSNITAIMEDYIKLAPAGAAIEKGDGYWNHYFNYQQKEDFDPMNGQCNFEYAKYFLDCPNSWLKPGDKNYIVRPKAYRDRTNPGHHKQDPSMDAQLPIKQCTLKPEILAYNARVQYQSTKYPWLESVSRFPIWATDHQVRENTSMRAGNIRLCACSPACSLECVLFLMMPSDVQREAFHRSFHDPGLPRCWRLHGLVLLAGLP
jgi:hypothetical protein